MNMKRRKWHTKTQSRRIDDNRTNDDGNECTLVMYLNDNIIHRKWLRSRCAVHKLNKFVFTLHQLQLHYFFSAAAVVSVVAAICVWRAFAGVTGWRWQAKFRVGTSTVVA